MTLPKYFLSVLIASAMACAPVFSQQSTVQPQAAVPRLVNFSGRAIDARGSAMRGVVGITFAIYKDQHEGAPLWVETQNANADETGHYSVELGSTKSDGLPSDLFSSGEAHWLGVRIHGGEEQARVLLLSVPYALKAADSETLGGLPASAFMLAAPANTSPAGATAPTNIATDNSLPPTGALTGTGTTSYLPLWTAGTALGNSALFQTGTGAATRIGINTTTPSSTLDVKGAATFRGAINMAATGTATAAAGKVSQAQNFTASAFNSNTLTGVNQSFHWRAEPVGNNTNHAGGSMNLLFAQGMANPSETGFAIASNGLVTFAAGQKFPGTGKGSVTSVSLSAPSSDFTVSGSQVTGTGTLAFDWNVAPTNAATPNAIVKRDVYGGFSSIIAQAVSFSTYGTPGAIDSVLGFNNSANTGGAGVYGYDAVANGVVGEGLVGVRAIGTTWGVLSQADSGGYAGWFNGDVVVAGNLAKSGGSFKIDHPLDPANKYLYHSFVESPDMMNIYNGNVTTDRDGNAVVSLPDWFESLNRDFRYQLTVIGQFAQAIVSKEISDDRFTIKTDKPNVKVSWQVTGIRQDAWAKAHRIPVEEMKPEPERGSYLHPELYGAPEEKSMLRAKSRQVTRQWKEARTAAYRDIEHGPLKP